jgi:hypothetical protein
MSGLSGAKLERLYQTVRCLAVSEDGWPVADHRVRRRGRMGLRHALSGCRTQLLGRRRAA